MNKFLLAFLLALMLVSTQAFKLRLNSKQDATEEGGAGEASEEGQDSGDGSGDGSGEGDGSGDGSVEGDGSTEGGENNECVCPKQCKQSFYLGCLLWEGQTPI